MKSKAFQYFMCKCEIPQLQAPSCLTLLPFRKVERQEISPAVVWLTFYYRKFQACVKVGRG